MFGEVVSMGLALIPSAAGERAAAAGWLFDAQALAALATSTTAQVKCVMPNANG